ncbi:cobalamin biosynthesis protein CobD [Aquabacter sp. L1I39]|uniref:adenosylcobinamide-phosphate synthase CbiB n=1 Tax=Aquabacter sp. L1I39 TaxID=2820278 RepID=UPI001ADCC0F4|nr:adenosylcobinamide-phosphate synthase CbiB [Aquabacter sp. L1I39]QTL06132.1 cobalamin biosynthesis protein CobD [Aquabacter sp. L1I39]
MFTALLVDAALGWPDCLYARIGHPVTWLGRLISLLDARLNRGSPAHRKALGVVTLLTVVSAAALPAFVLQEVAQQVSGRDWASMAVVGIMAWPLIASRSLYDHVAAVARPLRMGDLTAARRAVANIVGRDVSALDEAGVARAAMESLAENASDGVVAPLFWGALLGLPGIAAYKAVNTLDSMIGHRTERHEAFGWASARFDDLLNLIPARLSGLLIALACPRPERALRIMMRDGHRHRSPNAGYPEAAMAGALGVRLAGPRTYHHVVAQEPWLNAGAPDPAAADLDRALRLYAIAMVLAAALLAANGLMSVA